MTPVQPDEQGARATLLGIDLGERRIGLAIAERDAIAARPLATVNRGALASPADDAVVLARVVAEQRVDELVVGLPLEANGNEGPMATAARTWARAVGGAPRPARSRCATSACPATSPSRASARCRAGAPAARRRRPSATAIVRGWIERQRRSSCRTSSTPDAAREPVTG